MVQTEQKQNDTRIPHRLSQHTCTRFQHYYPSIDRFIRKRLTHFTIHEADRDDVYQDIIFKVLVVMERCDFESGPPLEHYISKIIKSVKSDYIRRKLRSIERDELLIKESQLVYQSMKSSDSTIAALENLEQRAVIQKLLRRLSLLEREVFRLMLDGHVPAEMSCLLGVKDKTVYNAIQRCKAKMSRYLSKAERY